MRIEIVSNPEEIDRVESKRILVEAFMAGYEAVPLSDLNPSFCSISDFRRFYEDYFESEFSHYLAGHLVWVQAYEEDQLLGWATFEKEVTPHEWYMNLIAVDPRQQGRGIGRALTFSLLNEASFQPVLAINLLLRKVNEKGRLFYESIGFVDAVYRRDDNFVDTSLLTGLRWANPSQESACDVSYKRESVQDAVEEDIDADHYRKNSSLQFGLGEDVLQLHSFAGNEHVLDIGCGDGRLTAKIAEKVPQGSVCGIDPSLAMIQLAQSLFPSEVATFAIGAAEDFDIDRQFDLVTAFSCLHWVRGQKTAFEGMTAALKPCGKLLILTYPQESPYHRLLEEVIYSEKWKDLAHSSACSHWLTSDEYGQIISKLNMKPLFFQTFRKKAPYRDEQHFKDYVKGWLPCLIPLPVALQDEFLNDLAACTQRHYGTVGSAGFEVPYDMIVMYLEKDSD